MSNLTVFNYNGQVISRRENGFVNLTQMCQANGKRLDHWKALKATDAYVKELQLNYPESRVVYSEEGVNGGTWGHPSLAINLARWISPAFAVWCDGHIFNLLSTGSTAMAQPTQPQLPQTYLEALEALVATEKQRVLLQAEKALLEETNLALAEAVDELFDYSSILRVAKFNGVSEKLFSWHRLKAVSLELGHEIKRVPSPRFEYQNLYSHDVWRVAYPGVALPETTTLVINRQ